MQRIQTPSNTKFMFKALSKETISLTEEDSKALPITDSLPYCSWAIAKLQCAYDQNKSKFRQFYMDHTHGDFITGYSYPHLPRLWGKSWLAPVLGMLPEFCAEDGLGPSRVDMQAAALAEKNGLAYYSVTNKRTLVMMGQKYTYQYERLQKKFSHSEAVKNNFALAFGKHTTITEISRLPDKQINPEWRKQREVTLSELKGRNLSHLSEPIAIIIDDIFNGFTKTFTESKDNEIKLDLENMCAKITLTVGAKILFGIPMEDKEFEKNTTELANAFNKVTRELTNIKNAIHHEVGNKFPRSRYFFGKSSLDEAKENLTSLVRKYYLNPYKENILAGESFIKDMAKLDPVNQEKESDKLILDTKEMVDKINLGLLAVHDTTSRLMQFTIMYLASNPHMLQRVREEIEKAGHSSKSQWSKEEIDSLKLLNACLKETERLHPGAPILGSIATEEVVFGDISWPVKGGYGGYEAAMKNRDKTRDVKLRKGDIVILPLYAMQRSSQYFKNPNEFQPDRFMIEKSKEANYRYCYRPFGFGERYCPGFQFAPLEAAVALVKLIELFDFNIDINPPFASELTATIKHKGPVVLTIREKNRIELTHRYS